ncbi:MAG: lytic transglycosylase domain-containing protein [Flavobacteriales bacterium]|nr:lytic transglycosylase domain-containing protein [Flavobacteriales bacterium]
MIMKKIFSISTVIVFAIVVGKLFIFSVPQEINSDDTNQKNLSNEYKVYALNMPADAQFADEKVPLDIIDVRERLDRELLVNTYWQSQGLLFFKRANKYFPMIEGILKEKGVPDDFKYLALIESGLQNVTSPAGAKGFWQLMPATAREQGLEVNSNVDERYDVKRSTEVACDYLLKSKEKFGTWTLAAASYNMGVSGINKQLIRQKVDNYYDLLLGEETSRYLFRIIAIKNIYENPKEYGFNFREKDLYTLQKTHFVKVDTVVSNLADFAISQGINYKELKILNPWLREIKLNNKSRKEYLIEIPNK